MHVPLVILGAGLSGLTLAHRLQQRKQNFLVLEARPRLGGRILTHRVSSGAPIELGATWFGPQHQQLRRLLAELGLGSFPQHQDSWVHFQAAANQAVQRVAVPPTNAPNYRIRGGTDRLTSALATRLPPEAIRLNAAVEALDFSDSAHVRIYIRDAHGKSTSLSAASVVSTLPPWLFAATLTCTPALPSRLMEVAQSTRTWMGESIKAGARFSDGFWRKPGQSGTLFSNVGPITEWYDHVDATGTVHAMKGFLHPSLHDAPPASRTSAIRRQLAEVYGDEVVAEGDIVHLDWQVEPFTYAPYLKPLVPHQNNGHPLYRQPYYDGKLWLSGTETAERYAGYMEGAVASAERIDQELQHHLS